MLQVGFTLGVTTAAAAGVSLGYLVWGNAQQACQAFGQPKPELLIHEGDKQVWGLKTRAALTQAWNSQVRASLGGAAQWLAQQGL